MIKLADGHEGTSSTSSIITSFSLNVYGFGNHTYILYVDNYGGETHTDNIKIEVKQGNEELHQVYFFCSDMYFDFKNGEYVVPLTCKVKLYNPGATAVSVTEVTYSWDIDSSSLKNTLSSPWSVNYPETISPGAYGDITFSTTAKVYGTLDGVNLIKDLYGLNSLISITYDVHWHYANGYNKKMSSFIGSDIININADLNDVALDYGGDIAIALFLVYELPYEAGLSLIERAGISVIKGFSVNWLKNYLITRFSWGDYHEKYS